MRNSKKSKLNSLCVFLKRLNLPTDGHRLTGIRNGVIARLRRSRGNLSEKRNFLPTDEWFDKLTTALGLTLIRIKHARSIRVHLCFPPKIPSAFFQKCGYVVIFLLFSQCIGVSKNGKDKPFAAIGAAIGKSDSQSGVTQASPGANSGGGWTNFFGGSSSVPDGKSAIRFKVYDDPMPAPVTSGVLNFYTEYEFIESLFDSASDVPPAEILKLTIDHIEIINSAFPALPIVIVPTHKERRIEIRRNNHFLPLAMGVSLQAGSYSNIKVFLNPKAYAYFNDREYVVNVTQNVASFGNSFSVENGKITSLRTITATESDSGFIQNHGSYTRNNFDTVQFVDHVYQKNNSVQFNLSLNLVPAGQTVHSPLEKLNVMVSQITAVDKAKSGYTLNDQPTIFEFLSLRNGFVGLATHNEIPSTDYEYFEVMLGRNNTVDVDGNNSPLLMDNRSQSTFRFHGPFTAQSARMMELFLHLDPNKSVYFVPNKGFVFDPVLKLESSLSMTGDQNVLLTDKLNKRINLAGKDANLVIQGKVESVNPVLANNAQGMQTIYSDVTVSVTDVLRGALTDTVIQFRTIGGEYNGVKLKVSTMPEFRSGESVILFLQKSGNSYSLIRGETGKVETLTIPTIAKKWNGDFPVIPYKANPNLIGFNTSNANGQIDQIRAGSDIWSFLNSKSRVSLKFDGTTSNNSTTPPAVLDCSIDSKAAMRSLQKTVFANTSFDPDCTSQACSYKWSCVGETEILHFDIQVNTAQFSYDTIADSNSQYNLKTILAREFADILGIDLNTTDSSRLAYKYIDSGTVLSSLSSDDTDAVRGVYGNLSSEEDINNNKIKSFEQTADSFCNSPCLSPDEETNALFAMNSGDQSALALYNSTLANEGIDNFDWRKEKFLKFQKTYFVAISYTKITEVYPF